MITIYGFRYVTKKSRAIRAGSFLYIIFQKCIFIGYAERLGKYEFDIPFSRRQLADYLAVERRGLSS